MTATGTQAAKARSPRDTPGYDWRLLVLLGGIGALMVAAGMGATGNGHGAPVPTVAVSVAAQPLAGDGMPWDVPPAYVLVLAVMAQGNQDALLTFRSGQIYDFVVTQDGREVWRWSHGRAFHEAVHQQRFAAGRLALFTAVWDGRDMDGRQVTGAVELRAVLTADPTVASDALILELP